MADDLEKPILGEAYWGEHLENFLAQGVFPSPEFFEEAFMRLKPEDSDPYANLKISLKDVRDTGVPASVFYFTMLRRITTLEEMRERHPEFGTGREEKIISYLLNDAFMEHALPYLGTEEAFEDNFVGEDSKIIFHNARIEATGKEAKQLKRQRLGEIIKAAVDYAHQKGNEEMVQRLTEREVSGVKFADFIS